MSFDMGRQGSENTIGILDVKPGSPAFQDIGKLFVGISQHSLDAGRPPHRCLWRTPRLVWEDLSIPESVIGSLYHEFQALFALAEKMFGLLDLYNELLYSNGTTERMPKFLPIIRFREIGIGPLCQRSHSAVVRDVCGHDHDRERGVQTSGVL